MGGRPKSRRLERRAQGLTVPTEQDTNPNRFSMTANFWSGPYPSPADLAALEAVVPGCAAQIMQDAHDQGVHRKYLERTVVDSNVRAQLIGAIGGIVVSLVLIVMGSIVAFHGFPWEGVIEALSGFVGAIGATIYSITQQRQERAEKRARQQRIDATRNPRR